VCETIYPMSMYETTPHYDYQIYPKD